MAEIRSEIERERDVCLSGSWYERREPRARALPFEKSAIVLLIIGNTR